ncbi:Probable pyridine nucleotide-disulfide oxidoreductase [Lactobacillus equicursoris DSM 19284 = JCM 14600 = CIP 110162]|uniref:Pyridine nucleotide-disulfide oxidoreductase n=2 Tax=Lactobacillus equicursoris TaxID=420645 RepID=K0NZ47_9LACO|nr:pyridine nucleotide-disulfide oxidoreductase [Lactobacillus equicursoris DSM 19284 = JCM 14600 = CIP 110162]CCK85500.1 Probable pyridine nucleotide-disulfide oxidoreductase [Lactobacillus equicursoris DSM 19284 = JCM 14600 = CIP 110162]
MKTVKNIIIGFGKGGKTLAKFLGQQGEEVLLVEKSPKMYGGTCINIACLPSKRLILEAGVGSDFSEAVAGKNEMTALLREKNYQMLAQEETVTVLDGAAHFIGEKEIEVTGPAGKQSFQGDRIFINTGASPVLPPVPGLKESKKRLDSTQAMDLNDLPKELLILGAGYIGLEFAAMFANFGSQVTVLDHSPEFLPREDDDIRAAVKADLEAVGVKFILGADVDKVGDEADKVVAHYQLGGEKMQLSADKILVAAGRRANTADLNLTAAGIETDDRGNIKVDDHLRTSADQVWALGDVKGGPQFTYVSLDDFRIVKDQLFGEGKRKVSDRQILPTSVFITPPLSAVGLNEKAAQKAGISYQLFKLPVAAIPKAKVAKDSQGFFKALVDPASGQILGASLYGLESHELINQITLAMQAKLPYSFLRDQIYTHPTMSEAFNDLFK